MSFCANCGAELEAGAKFCGNCGQPVLGKPVFETKAMPPPTFEPPSKAPEEKRKKPRRRWLILVVAIPLLALGIAYNYYGKDILKFKEKIIEKISKGKSIEKVVKEKPIEKVVKKQEPIPTKGFSPPFDRSSLDRYATTVRFFESGYGSLPINERIYKTDFSSFEARYINWEVSLKHPAPGRRIDFNIDAVWRRSDGSIYTKETKKAYIESDWSTSWHVSGWGNRNPGTWPVGTYVVELYVEGKRIAKGGFRIY